MQTAQVLFQTEHIQFDKYPDALVPAIVQDSRSRKVLMLGYVSREAWQKTIETGKVTFFSRSKQRLWTKGETSGNYLYLREARLDCDADALLLLVEPVGPVCHTGEDTCFFENNHPEGFLFLQELAQLIHERKVMPKEGAYTSHLFEKGISKIAQKVGEEAVETVIEAMKKDLPRLHEEAADLMYHLLVLLEACDTSFDAVAEVLRQRHLTKGK